MNALDQCYLEILRFGLLNMRNATQVGDWDPCRAEAEHLHVIPTLFGEVNFHRHAHYMQFFKGEYLKWIDESHRDDMKDYALWYFPMWRKMDEIILANTKHDVDK